MKTQDLSDQKSCWYNKKWVRGMNSMWKQGAMATRQTYVVTIYGINWCSTYGAQTPKLAGVAKKILSQQYSSSLAERN